MRFLKRVRLVLPMTIGTLVVAGAESTAQSPVPVPALAPPRQIAAPDASPSEIRPVARIVTANPIARLAAELRRVHPGQIEWGPVTPPRGIIHVVHPPKGIDFKIRIAKVPENIDPGILAPRP